MYLHLGQNTIVHESEILGIFDLDITSQSYRTRQYLNRADGMGKWSASAKSCQELCGLCRTQNQRKPDGLYRPALQPDAAAPVGGGDPDRLNL